LKIQEPAAKQTALAHLAARMKAGEWAELKTENLIETLRARGASGAIFGYNEDAAWDPKTRQFFYVGGDHNDTVRCVTYTDTTNTWTILPQPPWVGKGTSHGYSHHGLDAERGLLYYFPFGNRARTVHRYDIARGAWSALPRLDPPEYLACCVGVEYFPELEGSSWPTAAAARAASTCSGRRPSNGPRWPAACPWGSITTPASTAPPTKSFCWAAVTAQATSTSSTPPGK
jgi:hypothetical protein